MPVDLLLVEADPAGGEPRVPADRLAPWVLAIGGEARPDWQPAGPGGKR